jgi:hypothetical protein
VGLVGAYIMMDSLLAAERVLRDWIRHQPRSHEPWRPGAMRSGGK